MTLCLYKIVFQGCPLRGALLYTEVQRIHACTWGTDIEIIHKYANVLWTV